MIVFEQRACTVLFNLLRSHQIEGPFLLPSNICPIVPLVFLKAGRAFEFIDIRCDTLCMDLQELTSRWEACDRVQPAGVIYVRSYGAILDTGDVFASIKNMTPSALIVDDRCLCSPAFDAKLLPSTDVALYSTGYAKFVDVGFGGVGVVREGVPYDRANLIYNAKDLAKISSSYKNALDSKIAFDYMDNYWLDTAVPDCSWKEFQLLVERENIRVREIKKNINFVYSSRLPKEIQFAPEFQSWRFNIHVKDKMALLDAINAAGFFASDHYQSLVGVFGFGNGRQSCEVHKYTVNLFNDRYFSVERAEGLVNILLDSKLLIPSGILK